MQSQNLYFLAIIPNGKIAGEVTFFKEHIAQHYNSHKALRVVPHITLKAPFTIHALYMGDVLGWFDNLNLKTTPFTLWLNGFDSFNNPNNPVLFIKPAASPPLLALQQEIISAFAQRFPDIGLYHAEKVFAPHMTIAYRDLSPAMFKNAWAEFKDKEYSAQFDVQSVFLLQHDGTKWNIISEKKL